MLKDTKVFIRPNRSIRFACRWGVITKVDYTKGLPYTVRLNKDSLEYNFYKEELMTAQNFFDWLEIGAWAESRSTGYRAQVTAKRFPMVELEGKRSPFHYTSLLPVHKCPSCNVYKAGIFNQECDECLDGGILDVENQSN